MSQNKISAVRMSRYRPSHSFHAYLSRCYPSHSEHAIKETASFRLPTSSLLTLSAVNRKLYRLPATLLAPPRRPRALHRPNGHHPRLLSSVGTRRLGWPMWHNFVVTANYRCTTPTGVEPTRPRPLPTAARAQRVITDESRKRAETDQCVSSEVKCGALRFVAILWLWLELDNR